MENRKTITLNLSLHRKARVWLFELPEAIFTGDETYELSMPATKSPIHMMRQAAVELMIPSGAKIAYGLLGGIFSPSNSGRLHVQMEVCKEPGMPFGNSLTSALDKVSIGLPKEYIPGIVKGMFRATRQTGEVPSGKLLFNCAAHGHIGSSEWVFMHLSSTVTKILSFYNESLSKEGAAELLETELE